MQHQALCIISLPYVNSNWSYGPETAKWGHDLCDLDFDLWPWPFAWTSRLSTVMTPENFRMIRWREHREKGVTDGRTDRDRQKEVFYKLLGRSLKQFACMFDITERLFIVFIGQLGTWWGYTGLDTLGANEINVRNTLPMWTWSHLNLRLSGPQPRALSRDQGERQILTEGTCL